jgi:chromate transporter
MAVVTVQIARSALVDIPSLLLAIVGAVGLIGLKLNTSWVVVGAGVLGALVKAIR